MNTKKLLPKNFADLSKKSLIEEYIKENNVVPDYRYLTEYSSETKDLLSFGETQLKYRYQESSKASYEKFENESLDELTLGKRLQESLINKDKIVSQGSLGSFQRLKADLKRIEKELDEKLARENLIDEFGFVFVEDFNSNDNINLEKTLSSCEIKNSFLTLKETSSSKIKIKEFINSYSVTGYVREANSINSYGLNNFKECLLTGNNYQHIVLGDSSKADFYLEIEIILNNKLDIDYFNINFNENSTGTYICEVYYLGESGSYTLSSDKQKQVNQGENLFSIDNSNVSKIKIVASSSEENLRRNNDYGFLFSLGGFEICKKQYVEKGTYFSKGIDVVNENSESLDYSFANIKSVGCSLLYEGTSVQFYGSKDNVNWNPADENGLISFNKNEGTINRVKEDPEGKDLLSIGSLKCKTNAIINVNETVNKIYRGVGSKTDSNNKTTFYVKIVAGSYKFVNPVSINDVEYLEGTSIPEGVYKISIDSNDHETYEEISNRFLTWKNIAFKTNNENIDDLNSFYILNNQAYLKIDTELGLDEEILFDTSLLSSNNKLFIKAELSTGDSSVTPIIDDIRVKVI